MSAEFKFHPLERKHLACFHNWLNQPHVSDRWGGPKSLDQVDRDYFAVDESCRADRFVVYLNNDPCGYIQCYKTIESTDGWWQNHQEEGIVGIDFFIGEKSLTNRGLGSAMISAFIGILTNDSSVKKIIADPSPQNLASIKCLARAGFDDKGLIQTPDGQAILMEYTKSSS